MSEMTSDEAWERFVASSESGDAGLIRIDGGAYAAARVREAQEPLALLEALARKYGIAAVESVAGQPWWMVVVSKATKTEGCPTGLLYQASQDGEGNGYTSADAFALLAEREKAR